MQSVSQFMPANSTVSLQTGGLGQLFAALTNELKSDLPTDPQGLQPADLKRPTGPVEFSRFLHEAAAVTAPGSTPTGQQKSPPTIGNILPDHGQFPATVQVDSRSSADSSTAARRIIDMKSATQKALPASFAHLVPDPQQAEDHTDFPLVSNPRQVRLPQLPNLEQTPNATASKLAWRLAESSIKSVPVEQKTNHLSTLVSPQNPLLLEIGSDLPDDPSNELSNANLWEPNTPEPLAPLAQTMIAFTGGQSATIANAHPLMPAAPPEQRRQDLNSDEALQNPLALISSLPLPEDALPRPEISMDVAGTEPDSTDVPAPGRVTPPQSLATPSPEHHSDPSASRGEKPRAQDTHRPPFSEVLTSVPTSPVNIVGDDSMFIQASSHNTPTTASDAKRPASENDLNRLNRSASVEPNSRASDGQPTQTEMQPFQSLQVASASQIEAAPGAELQQRTVPQTVTANSQNNLSEQTAVSPDSVPLTKPSQQSRAGAEVGVPTPVEQPHLNATGDTHTPSTAPELTSNFEPWASDTTSRFELPQHVTHAESLNVNLPVKARAMASPLTGQYDRRGRAVGSVTGLATQSPGPSQSVTFASQKEHLEQRPLIGQVHEQADMAPSFIPDSQTETEPSPATNMAPAVAVVSFNQPVRGEPIQDFGNPILNGSQRSGITKHIATESALDAEELKKSRTPESSLSRIIPMMSEAEFTPAYDQPQQAPAISQASLNGLVDATISSALILEEGGSQRFQMRLDPPELGGIEIEIHKSTNGAVSIHVKAASGQTHSLLEHHAAEISQALNDQGLAHAQFDFSHDQQSRPQDQQLNDQEYYEQLRLTREAKQLQTSETQLFDAPSAATASQHTATTHQRFSFRA